MRGLLWLTLGTALAVGIVAPAIDDVLRAGEVVVRCVVERGGPACDRVRNQGWAR